ncbi:hypothetical protein D0Z00_002332 [Geotrichum galactomycetum]|uniref:Uncharacterized protein n=1 Tax=Geotrichum galactomycetum TaxID=27317 RepID=A0ACB6V4H2_9ASCO|nr:hypothetical protein D0Z00_002332 [Geotrichum candidum]
MLTAPVATMSMAETYFLASKAQSKLTHEASKNNHNLRVLVSHANLLDNLMESLSKKKMLPETPLKPTYVNQYNNPSHFSTIHEEEEEEEEDDEDFSEDEYSEEEEEFEPKSYKQMPTIDDYSKLTPNIYDHEVQVVEISCDDEEEEDEDSEDSNSTVISSPESIPSLSYSSEEESEDELETVPVKRQEISLTPDYKVSATPISISTAHDVLVN